MNASFELTLKIAVSTAVGLFIGLERQWTHKEAGIRTFAIAGMLGTLCWLVTPALALVQLSTVVLAILLINISSLWKEHHLEITTSFALAATNVLGILIGTGQYVLALTSAIVITALLSWKTELITLSSKLTEAEIRGTLLLAFLCAVIYPLLPNQTVDPWHILNPRSVWLTVILVAGLKFISYILLRQFGTRGIRYSALLGGLVNSAATALLLGQAIKDSPTLEADTPSNLLLADAAMILRNGILVLMFVLPRGFEPALATMVVLVPMMLVAAGAAFFAQMMNPGHMPPSAAPFSRDPSNTTQQDSDEQSISLDADHDHNQDTQSAPGRPNERTEQHGPIPHGEQEPTPAGVTPPAQFPTNDKQWLRSPLSFRSIFGFTLLFLLLTGGSGFAKMIFGSLGFLVVIVVGALASAASSSVLVGQELAHQAIASSSAAMSMLLVTVAGLLENVVLLWAVTRQTGLSLRLFLFTLPIVLVGVLTAVLIHLVGSWN